MNIAFVTIAILDNWVSEIFRDQRTRFFSRCLMPSIFFCSILYGLWKDAKMHSELCEELASHERGSELTDNCSRSPDRARVVVAI